MGGKQGLVGSAADMPATAEEQLRQHRSLNGCGGAGMHACMLPEWSAAPSLHSVNCIPWMRAPPCPPTAAANSPCAPLQCPPWPHMDLLLTGKDEAPHVTGGLFPHPPHPSEFADLVGCWVKSGNSWSSYAPGVVGIHCLRDLRASCLAEVRATARGTGPPVPAVQVPAFFLLEH